MHYTRWIRMASVGLGAMGMLAAATGASAQSAAAGRPMTQERIDELSHKHDGFYGVLAPQNLSKRRPKAPFNLTGTWFIDLREGFDKYKFGPPYPEFYEAGQQAFKEAAEAKANGRNYRDSIGQCWPAGLPMIMTRVWPIDLIQLPTAIYMISGFMNSTRFIYLDGRDYTPESEVIPSYNGESIGHWEGKTLVVKTKYFETKNHWIDTGIPISDKFEVTERIQLLDGGKTLEIEYIMVDPKNWKGEWHNTKHWMRQDYSDIGEVHCLPDLNEHLPGTLAGEAAIKAREERDKLGAAK